MTAPNPRDPITPASFTPLSTPTSTARRRRSLRGGLALALVPFVLAMLFLSTARSLYVRVIADAPAEVDVSGWSIAFGKRYLLRPGEYTVTASAPGYTLLTTAITVDERPQQQLELTLQPLPGRLNVTTQPPGAEVRIDDAPVGRTPATDLAVAAGEHRLQLQAERFLPHTQTLAVSGRDIRQTVSVTLEPAWAMVSVASEPPGATVLVDGEAAGTTPARLEVLQGEHQLMLQLSGRADWSKPLTITAGTDVDLGVIALPPAPAEFELDSEPPGANVTLDGEFQGQTPLTLALEPDTEHRLSVFKPGYRRYSDTLRFPAGKHAQRNVKLTAQLGEVQVRVTPAEAEVRVNGRAVGKGSQTLSLPAVAHTIEVNLEGYGPVRQQVTPRPGLPQRVEVALSNKLAARAATTPTEVIGALGQTLRLFKPAESSLPDFTLGASRREPGRRANEVLRPVALRRMFYLQTTEVSNAQFRQYLADHNSGSVHGTSLNQGPQPVVQVSWQQAASFCNWLSQREGLPRFYQEAKGIVTGFDATATGYRLPSEAEWEWAARAAGTQWLRYSWGDKFPPGQAVANYADSSSAFVTGQVVEGYTDGHVASAPVGSFPANQNGLHDLDGNVAEWVNDVYSVAAENSPPQTDPLGAAHGDNYVIRGASWSQAKLSELRLAYRTYGQAGRDDVGFRLARYAE